MNRMLWPSDYRVMKKHFVIFESPGTFFHEQTERPIESWDVAAALKMADDVSERYGATPFAFHFITRERGNDDLDSRKTKESGRYFLGGRVMDLEQVKKEMPDAKILISNMEANSIGCVIVNNNSWKVTQPFTEKDALLEYSPPKKRAAA